MKARIRGPIIRPARHGTVVVMLALMLVVVFACTALCIDIGWTTTTKSELQNAADSASAAGAAQLQSRYATYLVTPVAQKAGVIASAQGSAATFSTRFAGFNGAGGVNSLLLPGGDIRFGFTDASGNLSLGGSAYPNTVQVTTRRDEAANTPLALFFAPMLGRKTLDMSATSCSTAYTGLITSFDARGGGENRPGGYNGWGDDFSQAGSAFRCTLLPLAFDVNHWNQFMSNGISPDGTSDTDAAGVPEIHVYPSPKNSPGNFGLLCIGPWTNANPIYSNWILNGPSSSDLQALVDAGSFPVSMASPKPWKGSPGLRSSLLTDFITILGQPRLLPLFKPVTQSPYQAASGSGSNTTYAIVGFVGVKVSTASGHGSNMDICVQPCDVIDATAIFDSATLYPAGTEPASQLKSFTHPPVKFTK